MSKEKSIFIFTKFDSNLELDGMKVYFIHPGQPFEPGKRMYKSIQQIERDKNVDVNKKIRETPERYVFFHFENETNLKFALENDLILSTYIFRLNSQKDIKKQIKNILENLELDYYNIYSGSSLSKFSDEEQAYGKKCMKTLFYILFQFLSAGFHERKDLKKVEDWMILFQESVQRGFIREFGIHTSCEDVTFETEFLINPQFREMLTESMMKICSNFMTNNFPDEASKFKNWKKDISTWKQSIKSILKKI